MTDWSHDAAGRGDSADGSRTNLGDIRMNATWLPRQLDPTAQTSILLPQHIFCSALLRKPNHHDITTALRVAIFDP